MRLQHLVALPAICLVAAEQQPLMERLKGYVDRITNLVPAAASNVEASTPLEVAAAKVANLAVTSLNVTNWKDVITPAKAKTPGESAEWLVYITGNKSCHGLCDNTTKAWNVSKPAPAMKPPSANRNRWRARS
jgi:hypothetical protein